MHDINLLRPLIEQEQELAKSRSRTNFYITFTAILILLIAGIIFGSKFYLLHQAKTLEAKKTALENETAEVKGIEESINNFNSIIAQLGSLNENKFLW